MVAPQILVLIVGVRILLGELPKADFSQLFFAMPAVTFGVALWFLRLSV